MELPVDTPSPNESRVRHPVMKFLTQAGYARYRKISRQRVGQLVKAGRIDLINGLIDVARADASLQQRPKRTRKQQPTKQPSSKSGKRSIRELFYVCDSCLAEILVNPGTPLPAAISCPNCGADITVVDLLELNTRVRSITRNC